MPTPNNMPVKGNGLTTVTRHRRSNCNAGCCPDTRTERVPAIKRGPRRIRSTAMADALRAAGKVR